MGAFSNTFGINNNGLLANHILPLELIWDNILNIPISDPFNVSDWNDFFNLPINGSIFTSVLVDANKVSLFGGKNIVLAESLFDYENGDHLIEMNDYAGCIIEIGVDAFGDNNYSGCYNLSHAVFPAVTTIREMAFMNTTVSFEIPASTIIIDKDAFLLFSSDIVVNSNNPLFSSQEGILFNKDKSLLIRCPISKIGEYIIPSSVITIESRAFESCIYLTVITIPESVITIKEEAFSNCTIENILADSVITIHDRVFYNCSNLLSASFVSCITLGPQVFQECILLNSVILPEVVTIGNSAFFNCKSLSSIDFPNVEILLGSVFWYLDLLTSVNLPKLKTTTLVGNFEGCIALESITLPLVENLGTDFFYGCTNLKTINLPSVLSIDNHSFWDCPSLEVINTPNCLIFGSGDDNSIFNESTFGNSITITIPLSLNTDANVIYLQSNNNVTIINS